MTVCALQLDDFRNIAHYATDCCPNVNVIFGENGKGKTSVLEGLWLFSGCLSFRSNNNQELVRHGQEQARLAVQFTSGGREQTAKLEVTRRRKLWIGGLEQESPRRMLGRYPAVAFTPQTLRLAQGAPGDRRKFLDIAMSMQMPLFAVKLAKFNKTMAQRNALLRAGVAGDELAVWDSAFAAAAAEVTAARMRYVAELTPKAVALYAGIAGAREQLQVSLTPVGLQEPWDESAYLQALTLAKQRDMVLKTTTVGPHRDDVVLRLQGRLVRDYASQGQQRSVALALKLAEAQVLFATTDERPVVLLDDVFSELDARRQHELLRLLDGWQVFVSCCEPSHALHAQAGQLLPMA